MSDLDWLVKWYANHCDGDWEHGEGILISTLDNPGWSVQINLDGTELSDMVFETVEIERNDSDWFHCKIEKGVFYGAGGIFNLKEILVVFQTWAEQIEM